MAPPRAEVRAHLGLGSNVGDRIGLLRAARSELARHGVEVVAESSVYETSPQGDALDQRDFLNACLAVETDLRLDELLEVCKAVERDLGRDPDGAHHAPRPIDVDLLLAGDCEHRSERLTVPHPEVTARRFVLEPLLELDPSLRLPDGTELAPLLERVCDQRVELIGPL